uniref:CCHC-type domain-containing protein n=1 Tax=Maylandia zebra TaxID=106582 RepID=A0A3P9DKA8_9CICH
MTTEDGYCHPPAVFSIGADRGFLVYAGQPQACRKCGSTGHNADNCEQVRCRSCGKNGHITRDCKEPRRCHLCGSDTHMARDCTRPRSYSEAAKAGTEVERYEETDIGTNIGETCRKCGSTGHNADNCEQVRCRSCGKNGHITRDCKEPRRCHLCGSDTHMARDCTRCEQMRCRSCGKIGHITKDCKEPRKCHLCDSETHMARDCTRPRWRHHRPTSMRGMHGCKVQEIL